MTVKGQFSLRTSTSAFFVRYVLQYQSLILFVVNEVTNVKVHRVFSTKPPPTIAYVMMSRSNPARKGKYVYFLS